MGGKAGRVDWWRARLPTGRGRSGDRPSNFVSHFSVNVAAIVAVIVFSTELVSLFPSQLVDDE